MRNKKDGHMYFAKDLSVIGYANGFTLWHYRSKDSVQQVLACGHFDQAADMLRVGDLVFANLDVGGLPQNGMLTVCKNQNGQVTVSQPGFSL